MKRNPMVGIPLDPDGCNALIKGRHGYFLYNKNDQYVGRSLALYGEYCEAESAVFGQICKPGDIVIEAGANIGSHTVHLAKLVGTKGHVIALEPQRVVFQTLCANIALNSLTNVMAHQVAVGGENGSAVMPGIDYSKSGNFGGISVNMTGTGETVRMVKLDGFVNLPRLRLIKIDVEGFEQQVLEGAAETIQKHRPYLYLENDRQEKSEALIRKIQGLGYRAYWHMPPLYNPENFAQNRRNVFNRIVSANMLCLPEESKTKLSNYQEATDPTYHPLRK